MMLTKLIRHVADDSNVDDTGDFRAGMRAMRRLGAVSPLNRPIFKRRDQNMIKVAK